MMKMIKIIKFDKRPALYKVKGFHSGFVILFAVTIAAILLSIALGISNIALKEVKFGTSARDTNDAFFSADSGIECALINDKSTAKIFVDNPSSGSINCNNLSVTVNKDPTLPFWNFTVTGLGASNDGCAKVTVDKTNSQFTDIVAKGYNAGGGNGVCVPPPDSIERELETKY